MYYNGKNKVCIILTTRWRKSFDQIISLMLWELTSICKRRAPFHNEKSPSFSVSEPKQMFYCFGCGAGGNAATFLMKYENYSFREALETLADRAGIKLPEVNYGEEAKKKEEKRQQLRAVNKEAAIYYYKLLRSRKGVKGLRYLAERKLDQSTMRDFGLGYADGSGNDLCAYLKSCGFSDEVILEAGVAAFDEKRGLHDKFWNRVIFPIMDVRGQVIGFGGRVMGDGKPKYLNSPETEIFLTLPKDRKRPIRFYAKGIWMSFPCTRRVFTKRLHPWELLSQRGRLRCSNDTPNRCFWPMTAMTQESGLRSEVSVF